MRCLLVSPDPSSPNPSRTNTAFLSFADKLALGAAIGGWLGLLVGFAGRWAWPLDLFSHFRIQYAVVLALACVALALLRRPRIAVIALVGAVLAAASIVPYTGWQSQSAQAALTAQDEFQGEFRFVTFNVFYRNRNLAGIADYLQHVDADAVALQELEPPQARQLEALLLPSYPHVSAPAQNPYGAIIFSRWPIAYGETIQLVPGGARIAKTTIDWRGHPVTLIAAHLHWPIGSRNSHLRNAELQQLALLAKTIQGPLLIGGDFNVTPWSQNFREAIDESGLQDCSQGQGLIATWPTFFALASIQIDHCLASGDWRVISVRTGPSLGSDHYPVINDFELR